MRKNRDAKKAMKKASKDWRKLDDSTKLGIAAVAAVQLTLHVIAQAELVPRDKERVRGKKWLWFFANYINFAGPLAYLLFGRRP